MTVARSQNIADEFDEAIYELVGDILEETYKKGDEVDCISKYLKDKNIIEKFYTQELLFEPEKLKEKLKPFLPAAAKSCSKEKDPATMGSSAQQKSFFSTPSGIGTIMGIVALVLVIIGIIGGRLISSKKNRNRERVSTDDTL